MEFFGLILFYLLIALIFYKNRNKIKRIGFILALPLFTSNFIDPIVNKYKKFLRILVPIINIVGIFGMFFSVYVILRGIIDILLLKNSNTVYKVVPLIPGIEIKGFYLPLLEGLVSIFIAAFIHEFFHALYLRYYNYKVKSFGIALIGPLLAAFTEPDEEEFKKGKPNEIRTIAFAGPFSNILLAFLTLILIDIFSLPLNKVIEFKGLKIINVTKGSPADIYKLTPGLIIYGINNYTIKTLEDFRNAFYKFKPGEKIILVTNKGNFSVVLGNKSGKPYLGVLLEQVVEKRSILADILLKILNFLRILFIVNFGIGLANLLPIFILDGGIALRTMLKERTFAIVSLIFLGLLILNIILSLWM